MNNKIISYLQTLAVVFILSVTFPRIARAACTIVFSDSTCYSSRLDTCSNLDGGIQSIGVACNQVGSCWYCHEYLCSSSCGISGGGCICGNTKTTDCTKKSNCPANGQGNFCGYAKNGEQKVWCTRTFCNQCPSCNTSAPSNVSVTPVSITKAAVTWTPGANGVSQSIYAGTDKTEVESNCPAGAGPGLSCAVADPTLSASQNSYTSGNVLSPGTVYYWRVVTYKDSGCSSASTTVRAVSSCLISPASATMTVGASQTFTESVNSSTEIQKVDFSAPPGNISAAPGSDSSYQYQTSVTALNPTAPAVTLTGDVYLTGDTNPACTSTAAITVLNPGPWWQVKDSDIATNGDLQSKIPTGQFFGLAGGGGYPGVPAYSGSTNLANVNASQIGWLTKSTLSSPKVFDYQFFTNQIPADTVTYNLPSNTLDQAAINANTTASYGYYWYKFDGSVTGLDLSTSGNINVGSKKVILLVNGADFYINNPINLTDGQGFFMVVIGKNVSGNKGRILVGSTVGGGAGPNLEGIYVADGSLSTGIAATQLKVRGSVAAYGGVSLQRDLGGATNATTPAEFFEYAPDQIMLFPSRLGYRRLNWKEVAP